MRLLSCCVCVSVANVVTARKLFAPQNERRDLRHDSLRLVLWLSLLLRDINLEGNARRQN